MVMPNKVVEAKVAAGAGTQEGGRPTVVPAPAATNPELSDRPKRRLLITHIFIEGGCDRERRGP